MADACDGDVGVKRWDVYASSDAGFAKTPAPFALPAARCATSFDAPAGSGKIGYALLDVSCDGRPDLVVTRDGCDEQIGAQRWDGYVASNDGFAKAPATLTLPAARCGDRFDALGKNDHIQYSLIDVGADGRGDLVVSSDTCDETVGKDHWESYALE
jgi:hypothetical protein